MILGLNLKPFANSIASNTVSGILMCHFLELVNVSSL